MVKKVTVYVLKLCKMYSFKERLGMVSQLTYVDLVLLVQIGISGIDVPLLLVIVYYSPCSSPC